MIFHDAVCDHVKIGDIKIDYYLYRVVKYTVYYPPFSLSLSLSLLSLSLSSLSLLSLSLLSLSLSLSLSVGGHHNLFQ